MPDVYADITSGAHALDVIVNTFTATGAKRPKPVADALDRRESMHAKLATRTTPAAPDLVAAALDAVDREVPDLALDPDVSAALLRRQYGAVPGLWDQLQTRLLNGPRQACTSHTDAIVSAWSAPFDKAAQALRAARPVLGDVDLDDSAAILRIGPDGARAWSDATTASVTIATVVAGWRSLYGFTSGRLADGVGDQLIIADPQPEQVADDPDLWSGPHTRPAWALVAADVHLDLADLERPKATLTAVAALQRERSATDTRDRKAASSFARIL